MQKEEEQQPAAKKSRRNNSIDSMRQCRSLLLPATHHCCDSTHDDSDDGDEELVVEDEPMPEELLEEFVSEGEREGKEQVLESPRCDLVAASFAATSSSTPTKIAAEKRVARAARSAARRTCAGQLMMLLGLLADPLYIDGSDSKWRYRRS